MEDTERPGTGHPDMPGHDRAPDIDLDATLTLQAAAERAGVHERTLRRWIASGRLHAMKLGGQYRISPADLAEAMEAAPDTARAADTQVGHDGPGTGHAVRPVAGQVNPDTGQPPPVDLAPLAEVINRLSRENADLSAAASAWQVRALQAEERLAQLTATVERTDEAVDAAERDESGEQVQSHHDTENVQQGDIWGRLVRWWRGSNG